MEDKKLTVVSMPLTGGIKQDGIIDVLEKFVKDNELYDYSGDFEEDTPLDPPQPEEVYVSKLTPFERRMNAHSHLCNDLIQEVLLEAQAASATKVAEHLRNQIGVKRGAIEPKEIDMNYINPSDQDYCTRLATVRAYASASFEFSFRSRTDIFGDYVAVRAGFLGYKIKAEFVDE
jgi:hypothetical protein